MTLTNVPIDRTASAADWPYAVSSIPSETGRKGVSAAPEIWQLMLVDAFFAARSARMRALSRPKHISTRTKHLIGRRDQASLMCIHQALGECSSKISLASEGDPDDLSIDANRFCRRCQFRRNA